DAIHLTEDIIEIFVEATKLLSQTIKCDHVNILFNNEKARYFYINQALNPTNSKQGCDVIIPYNETTITEIIRSHSSIIRDDLSGRGKLTPGDLKFLTEGTKSDLSVPIINKNRVLAVINLSSYDSNYFTDNHQAQTEQVASLLGITLERSELIEKLNKKQSDVFLWKNKFNSLINNVGEPIAIIRLDYDLIYETNAAFQKLTGYASEELQGMRLSHVHPQQEEMILLKLDKCSSNGKANEPEKLILNRKDGVQIPVKLRFFHVGGNIIKFVFAIYEEISKPGSSSLSLNEKDDLTYELIQLHLLVINEINSLANSDLELNDIIKTALLSIKKIVDFDYAQISLFDKSGENIKNHTIISDRCREYDKQKSWNIIEGCDFYWYNLSKQNLKHQFTQKESISNQLERKLLSRIPEVLITKNRYLGTLILGWLEPDFYQKHQIEFIKQFAQQIALLIENVYLFQEHKKNLLHASVETELKKMIAANLDINNVLLNIVKLSVKKMQSQLATVRPVEHDTFLPGITISDPNCDKTAVLNFEKQNVTPEILKSDEPYIIEDIKYDDSNQLNRSASSSFEYTTCVAIPLKQKQKTIGILSNYWNIPFQLNSNELYLLKAIAKQASASIDSARLYQDSLRLCEQLEKEKQELENFVAIVADNLKMPLASIQGFTSTLLNNLKEKISDEALSYLQSIRNKVVKMQLYIDDLHEFTRAGQNFNIYEAVDILDLVEQAKNKLLDTINQKEIKIVVDKDLPNVYCDRNLMQQVFINLLENAIRDLGENNTKPKIAIGCRNGFENEIFFVHNNGTGIWKEFHENIFELFPGIEGMEDEDKGHGLALAIAKKIIEIHNGQIWFESEQGKGSTFYFSLPKRKV
ncbi:MAG: GAF domain-containing protein, partial [bacterium]